MNDLFLKIVSALITILVALITSVVIPWIKSKITAEQMELLDKYVEYAVRCAEQIYTPEEWQEKKVFVMDYITQVINQKLNLTLTYEDINTLVEGVVQEVKHG